MDLNPAHVRTLREIARHGSFSRAAESLHLSQPAVSLHMRQLEARCGTALLERVGKRAFPTRAGTVLLEHAGRAFAELEAGADLYCLHKNAWWQTARGALLDAGVFVVGLEYATGSQATVLGKPSASYFEAALDALDADPEHAWMVGDDVDADIGGAAALGMHTILVRTGKFRDDAGAWSAQPQAVVDSIADVPAFLESAL